MQCDPGLCAQFLYKTKKYSLTYVISDHFQYLVSVETFLSKFIGIL